MKKAEEKILEDFVVDVILKKYPDMEKSIAYSFVTKAFESNVIKSISKDDLQAWFIEKFEPYLFILGEEEYTQASIQALKIQFSMAGTDFGTSRQRDLGQKWADTIRGYLGELGVKQIFQKKWGLDVSLGHEPGKLEDYLPTDIHEIKNIATGEIYKPNITISIKTTKANGIWLDIPGDQFNHSQIYILALLGVNVDHLFSYFKYLSVFKDKILKKGLESNCIDQKQADDIYNSVPSFAKIFGYIPGFIDNDSKYSDYKYEGIKGRTNFKIHNWTGKYEQEYLVTIKEQQQAKKVEFSGIGEFTQSNRYIFGLDSLLYKDDEWKNKIILKL